VLIFTRKADESIIVGEGIEVRVLRVGRSSVRIGVTAARDVPVHRREVYDQIKAANLAAAADARTAADLAARLRARAGASQP
jgi:carbon storage regulator